MPIMCCMIELILQGFLCLCVILWKNWQNFSLYTIIQIDMVWVTLKCGDVPLQCGACGAWSWKKIVHHQWPTPLNETTIGSLHSQYTSHKSERRIYFVHFIADMRCCQAPKLKPSIPTYISTQMVISIIRLMVIVVSSKDRLMAYRKGTLWYMWCFIQRKFQVRFFGPVGCHEPKSSAFKS